MRVVIIRRRLKPQPDDLDEPKKSPPVSVGKALARLGVDETARAAYLKAQKDLKLAQTALKAAMRSGDQARIEQALTAFEAASARDAEAWRNVQL